MDLADPKYETEQKPKYFFQNWLSKKDPEKKQEAEQKPEDELKLKIEQKPE